MIKKEYLLLLFFSLFLTINICLGQTITDLSQNKVIDVSFSNNNLTINTTKQISYTLSTLKEPNRLVIDILNCSIAPEQIQDNIKSKYDENISISKIDGTHFRVVFLGDASLNRKAYLTNNEKTLIVKFARVIDSYESINKIIEEKQLNNTPPGVLKDISLEGDSERTEVSLQATKAIKYNTYVLHNPTRFAIDLLNILPPDSPLPKYNSTELVTGLRVGKAANGLAATRIVIDLSKDDVDWSVNTSNITNKLKIKFKVANTKKKPDKSNIRVVIDPGHGGYDFGANYGGFQEKDVNLVISKKLGKILEGLGVTVFYTRKEDLFISLAERVDITNSIKPNIFISIHANALNTKGIRGVETYYWTRQSQKLAYHVHKSILEEVSIPDHHIRQAKFFVIKYTPVPAILAELGFLSNIDDRKLLTNPAIQDKYAYALAKSVFKFLGIQMPKDKPASVEKKENDEVEKEKGNIKNQV